METDKDLKKNNPTGLTMSNVSNTCLISDSEEFKLFMQSTLCDINDDIGMMIENDDEGHRLELAIDAANKLRKICVRIGIEDVK